MAKKKTTVDDSTLIDEKKDDTGTVEAGEVADGGDANVDSGPVGEDPVTSAPDDSTPPAVTVPPAEDSASSQPDPAVVVASVDPAVVAGTKISLDIPLDVLKESHAMIFQFYSVSNSVAFRVKAKAVMDKLSVFIGEVEQSS